MLAHESGKMADVQKALDMINQTIAQLREKNDVRIRVGVSNLEELFSEVNDKERDVINKYTLNS